MAYRNMQYDRKTAKVAKYFARVSDGKFGVPISLQVSLCDQCMNRCIMCEHPLRKPFKMEVQSWLEKLRWFAARGIESVCYSGGDAMCYSDFNQVMETHIELGTKFGLITTGYVPKNIDLQLLAHATWIRVSLDAVTPAIYEKVRGGVSVEKVKRSVEAMVQAGVPVALGITLHADNVGDLDNVLAYAAGLGITDIETHHIAPGSAPQAMQVPEKWERRIEPFQNCHAVFYQLYIDAQGDVYPCCEIAGDSHAAPQGYGHGNLFRDDWDSVIWPAVIAYSKLNYQELQPACRSCCVQRLSQINFICGQIRNEKEFF